MTMGLIRGASRENCVVLTQRRRTPLRFDDEFVRHKVLDLIGDLELQGTPGNVVADRAGHAMHTALVTRLLRDGTLWEETTVEDEPPARSLFGYGWGRWRERFSQRLGRWVVRIP